MDSRPRKILFLLTHCSNCLFQTAECRSRTFPSSSLLPLPYSVQLFSPGLGGHRADQGEGRRSDLAFARWRGSRVKPRRSGLKRLLRPSGTGRRGRCSNVGGAQVSGIVRLQTALSDRPASRAPPPSSRRHADQRPDRRSPGRGDDDARLGGPGETLQHGPTEEAHVATMCQQAPRRPFAVLFTIPP